MTVIITLTALGSDTGPFNLYSNADGFTTALATGIAKATLEAGYSLTNVPDTATFVRAKSAGACTNYIDLSVSGIPTTTTTSTSSTSSTTTTAIPLCISGDPVATASCFEGQLKLFTVGAGHTAKINPGGYFYSGSGTRYYNAYIMNAADTQVLYTFTYVQTGATQGTWTSTLPSNILPAGTYRLKLNLVNCNSGSGTFTLTATCNS